MAEELDETGENDAGGVAAPVAPAPRAPAAPDVSQEAQDIDSGRALGVSRRGSQVPRGNDLPAPYSTASLSLATPQGDAAADRAFTAGRNDALGEQQAAQREQKQAEDNAKKSDNANILRTMEGSGQRHYTDPFGKVQPIIEPGTGKPLFTPSAKREKGVNPQTGEPAWVTSNRYGEPEYGHPQLVANTADPRDTKGYYDFGENGGMEPAGELDKLSQHPDFKVAKQAMALQRQQKAAMWKQAITPMEQVASDAKETYDLTQQRNIELQAHSAELQQQLEQAAANPQLKETQGGIMGFGGSPTDAALVAQSNKVALESRLQQVMQEQGELAEQLKPGGAMARQKRQAQLDLALFKAKAKHEEYSDMVKERRATLAAQGIAPETDPTLKSIQTAQQMYGNAVNQFAGISKKDADGQQAQSAAAGQPPQAIPEELQGEPFAMAQRGVKNIGGVSIDQIAQRYGDGLTQAAQPGDIIKIHNRVDEIANMLANPDTRLDGRVRQSLVEEQQYLTQLGTQRMARLSADDQRRVTDTIQQAAKARAMETAAIPFQALGQSLSNPNAPLVTLPRVPDSTTGTPSPTTLWGTTIPTNQAVTDAAGGVVNAAASAAESMTSPTGIALLAATGGVGLAAKAGVPFAKALLTAGGAAFAAWSAKDTIKLVQHARDVMKDPDASTMQKSEALAAPVITGAMSALAAGETAHVTAAKAIPAINKFFPEAFWKKSGVDAEQFAKDYPAAVRRVATNTGTPEDVALVQKINAAAKDAGVKVGDLARGRVVAENVTWEPRAVQKIIPESMKPSKPGGESGGLTFKNAATGETVKPETKTPGEPEAKATDDTAQQKALTAGEEKPGEPAQKEPEAPTPAPEAAAHTGAEKRAALIASGRTEADVARMSDTEVHSALQEHTDAAAEAAHAVGQVAKEAPPTWRVTVQKPQGGAPGYTQIDQVDEKGQNAGSTTPEKLLEQGYKLPDLSKLEQGQYTLGDLQKQEPAPAETATAVETKHGPVEGEPINKDWVSFHDDAKGLGIPRAEMPQVHAQDRGALTQFLAARGITHTQAMVYPTDLKPSQAEYSPAKVEQAKKFVGDDRAILVSSDNHVIDGHHQWMAKLTDAPKTPMRVIRLNAPAKDLIPQVKQFPSAETASGATTSSQPSEAGKPTSITPQEGASSPAAATIREPAIKRGANSPLKFVQTALDGAKVTGADKHTLRPVLMDFTRRLHEAAPDAFKDMEVHVLPDKEWQAHPQLGKRTPDSAAAYDQHTNTLYLNSDKLTGENLASAIVHEAGHFAEKFYLGEDFTQKEWESLSHEQREAAWKQYDTARSGAINPADLIKSKKARAEWVAMQFARVARGDTKGMSQRMKEALSKLLEAIRSVVKKWLGDAKLTTEALDKKIVEMLGYDKEQPGEKSAPNEKPPEPPAAPKSEEKPIQPEPKPEVKAPEKTKPDFQVIGNGEQVEWVDKKTGNKISAEIALVPGEKGTGSYIASIDTTTPTRIGGSSNHGEFTQSFEQAQADLKRMLEREGYSGLHASRVTKPTLRYGGSWATGVLEKQPGYEPAKKKELNDLLSSLQKAGDSIAKEMADSRRPEPFGNGPPEYGQSVRDSDISKIPKLVKDYGDFHLVLKWNKAPREIIKASDFARHYEKIVEGRESGGDRLREVFVRKEPFEGIGKTGPLGTPPESGSHDPEQDRLGKMAETLRENIAEAKASGKPTAVMEALLNRIAEKSQTPDADSGLLGSPSTPLSPIEKAKEAVKDFAKDIAKLPSYTGFNKVLNNWVGNRQIGIMRTERTVRAVMKAIPDKRTREAIANYIDAGGDMAELKRWAAAAKKPSLKAGYEAAQKLTPEQLATIDKIRQWFKDQFDRAVDGGVIKEESFLDDYITHVVDKPFVGGGASSPYGGKIAAKFKYSKQRTFPNFHELEEAGYSARTKDVAEIMAAYGTHLTNAIETRRLAKALLSEKNAAGEPLGKLILGHYTAEEGSKANYINDPAAAKDGDITYKAVSHPAFRAWRWSGLSPESGKPIIQQGEIGVHPDIHGQLENAIGRSAIRQWYDSPGSPASNLAKVALKALDVSQSALKGTMLGGISTFHAVHEYKRALGNRVVINPVITKQIDPNDPRTQMMMRSGLMLSGDRDAENLFSEGLGSRSLVDKVPAIGKVSRAVADYTFHQLIPALKWHAWNAVYERNLKLFGRQASPEDVAYLTSRQVNARFGHLNLADLNRNPTAQHIASWLLLAPDFLESNVRNYGQDAKGATGAKTGREPFKALVATALTLWVIARVMNRMSDDNPHYEEPFGVIHNGGRYTMRNEAEDLWRLYNEPGRFVSGRLSPGMQTADQLRTGQNWRGEKVTTGDTLKEFLTKFIPISGRWIPGMKQLVEKTATGGARTVSPFEEFLSSQGIQVARHSPASAAYDLAHKYKVAQGIKEDVGTYPVSKYQQLRYALEDDDMKRANEEAEKLLAEEKTKVPFFNRSVAVRKLQTAFQHSLEQPWTKSREMDQDFIKSLKPDDRAKVVKAEQERQAIARRFATMFALPTKELAGRN